MNQKPKPPVQTLTTLAKKKVQEADNQLSIDERNDSLLYVIATKIYHILARHIRRMATV
ncbi:hypothetical protein M8C21_003914, partial [Ambrosia artemisiifolia]